MFKNIGIFVKEKTDEGIDSHGLDVLISSLNKHTSNIFIEETSIQLRSIDTFPTNFIFFFL